MNDSFRESLGRSIDEAAAARTEADRSRRHENDLEAELMSRRRHLQAPLSALLREHVSEFVAVMRERGARPPVPLVRIRTSPAVRPAKGLRGRFGAQEEVPGKVVREVVDRTDVWIVSSQATSTIRSRVRGTFGSGPKLVVAFRGLAVDLDDTLHVYRGGYTLDTGYDDPPLTWRTTDWTRIPPRQYAGTGGRPTDAFGLGIAFSADPTSDLAVLSGPLVREGEAAAHEVPDLLAPLADVDPHHMVDQLAAQPLVVELRAFLRELAVRSTR